MSKFEALCMFEGMVGDERYALELDVVMEAMGASAHDMLFQAFLLVRHVMHHHEDFAGDENGEDTPTFLAMLKGHEAWAQALKALDSLDKASTYSAPEDSYLARTSHMR